MDFLFICLGLQRGSSCNAAELRPLSYKPPPQVLKTCFLCHKVKEICVLCHTGPGHLRVHCHTGFPNIYKAFVLEVQSDEKLNFDGYIYPFGRYSLRPLNFEIIHMKK